MEEKKYKLYEGCELKLKTDPTSEDLLRLKEAGIDLRDGTNFASALIEAHYDTALMKDICGIIFENLPEDFGGKVSGKVFKEALTDFFGLFGLYFLS